MSQLAQNDNPKSAEELFCQWLSLLETSKLVVLLGELGIGIHFVIAVPMAPHGKIANATMNQKHYVSSQHIIDSCYQEELFTHICSKD
ncbi:hypothetical protein MUK42_28398 [Musa troglodytarum]|uniref:Uncharacterized protein n=1 Tax=Musa troglodytarum TaxID=320322 RepID=A0A9E7F964_9LILI|nr:hypothetical protein MUK42_28398 [Musa troglodytarum]